MKSASALRRSSVLVAPGLLLQCSSHASRSARAFLVLATDGRWGIGLRSLSAVFQSHASRVEIARTLSPSFASARAFARSSGCSDFPRRSGRHRSTDVVLLLEQEARTS